MGNGINHHPLHTGTGAVIPKCWAGGEHDLPTAAVGLADGVNGGIGSVEEADLSRADPPQ